MTKSTQIDPVTVQVLRNKVASLVDEMHYHFYRSGYSTIIRESKDFSCVILDRDGKLIVPPPMFFHGLALVLTSVPAPVQRYAPEYGTPTDCLLPVRHVENVSVPVNTGRYALVLRYHPAL